MLYALLQQRIFKISRAEVRRLIVKGAVYVNGRRCRIAGRSLPEQSLIRLEYHPRREAPVFTPEMLQQCILYHRNGILVVNKPAGIPTTPTLDEARFNLVTTMEKWLGHKPGIHHRLDAATSGCILFTTNPERNGFVARLFQENLIHKEYLAVVECRIEPPEQWEVKNQLVRAARKKNRYASTEKLGLENHEGSFAWSRFRILDKKAGRALVHCIPITGRTHQLRVHLSEFGLPVVGDRLYGGPNHARLLLHAHQLSFREEDGSEVKIEAPLPDGFWTTA